MWQKIEKEEKPAAVGDPTQGYDHRTNSNSHNPFYVLAQVALVLDPSSGTQWRSQNTTDARAQHGHTTLICTKFYSLPGQF